MPTQPALPPLSTLLTFPFRTRRDTGQLLLIAVLICGAQLAFFPLSIVIEAGFSLQVARAILLNGGAPCLPQELDWQSILRDGLRRCGLWCIFLLPGLGLVLLVVTGGSLYAWQAGFTREAVSWLYLILIGGLGAALFLCLVGAVFANMAAMHVLRSEAFSAGFQFQAWLPVLRTRFAVFEIIELAVFLGGGLLMLLLAATVLPAAIFCIGAPFLFTAGSLYLRLVSTAAVAVIYRDAIINIGQG
jgi:hypothetical protein